MKSNFKIGDLLLYKQQVHICSALKGKRVTRTIKIEKNVFGDVLSPCENSSNHRFKPLQEDKQVHKDRFLKALYLSAYLIANKEQIENYKELTKTNQQAINIICRLWNIANEKTVRHRLNISSTVGTISIYGYHVDDKLREINKLVEECSILAGTPLYRYSLVKRTLFKITGSHSSKLKVVNKLSVQDDLNHLHQRELTTLNKWKELTNAKS